MRDLKHLGETLKQIKYRKPQPRFCPACGSHRINQLPNMGILPETYACEDCGYNGVLVLELEREREEQDKL